MRRGQKSQSHIRHQRSVGLYHSPYQRGGTIFRQPPNPWGFTNYKPFDPMILRSIRAKKKKTKQKGGKVHPVIYPWKNKGRQGINRRRRRR